MNYTTVIMNTKQSPSGDQSTQLIKVDTNCIFRNQQFGENKHGLIRLTNVLHCSTESLFENVLVITATVFKTKIRLCQKPLKREKKIFANFLSSKGYYKTLICASIFTSLGMCRGGKK